MSKILVLYATRGAGQESRVLMSHEVVCAFTQHEAWQELFVLYATRCWARIVVLYATRCWARIVVLYATRGGVRIVVLYATRGAGQESRVLMSHEVVCSFMQYEAWQELFVLLRNTRLGKSWFVLLRNTRLGKSWFVLYATRGWARVGLCF